MRREIPFRSALLGAILVGAATLLDCASSTPSLPSARLTSPTPTGLPEDVVRAEEFADYLAEQLLLNPTQRESVSKAALRLLERNTEALSAAQTGAPLRLRTLKKNSEAFELELMATLTPDQRRRYIGLKRRLTLGSPHSPGGALQ
jgi:hypothetical protein